MQHVPKKHFLTPTQVLLAGNHAPTLTIRPGAAGQRPTTATNLGKGYPVGVGVPSPGDSRDVACRDEVYQQPQALASVAYVPTKLPQGRVDVSPTGVLTYVACQDDGTGNTVETITNGLAGLDKMTSVEKAARRDKTRTGGRCSWNLMVWFLFAATLLMVDVVGAVFAPVDSAALKAAVGTCTLASPSVCTGGCLGETPDGSCPDFAASNDATGNPYGVIGSWDVSSVTNMYRSKCTLSLPLCGHAFRCCVF